MVRERMSRPSSSVPNQCAALGPISRPVQVELRRIIRSEPWREDAQTTKSTSRAHAQSQPAAAVSMRSSRPDFLCDGVGIHPVTGCGHAGREAQALQHFGPLRCFTLAEVRILIYGLNYAPELTGIGKYTGEMAAWLAERGHEVRVVTAPPYYPAWRVREDYRGKLYRTENGAKDGEPIVYRTPLYVPEKPTGIKRMVHLFSFMLGSLPVMLRQIFWQPEIVFTVEPTFFCAPLALLVARAAGAASWLHVQDFEVDAAFDLGLLPAEGPIH